MVNNSCQSFSERQSQRQERIGGLRRGRLLKKGCQMHPHLSDEQHSFYRIELCFTKAASHCKIYVTRQVVLKTNSLKDISLHLQEPKVALFHSACTYKRRKSSFRPSLGKQYFNSNVNAKCQKKNNVVMQATGCFCSLLTCFLPSLDFHCVFTTLFMIVFTAF